MAGFIDAHRHINTGPEEKAQMQRQLEAGYTTILSGGGPGDGNLTLRQHIESGQINGPRVIPSERLRLAGMTPESAREAVRAMKAAGIDYTGEISLTPVPGPSAARARGAARRARRRQEGRRQRASARRELAGDERGRRDGHPAARALAEQGLGQQGRCAEARGGRHEDPDDDRLRRARDRRVRRRTTRRASATASRGPTASSTASAAASRPATRWSTRARSSTRAASSATARTRPTTRSRASSTS